MPRSSYIVSMVRMNIRRNKHHYLDLISAYCYNYYSLRHRMDHVLPDEVNMQATNSTGIINIADKR